LGLGGGGSSTLTYYLIILKYLKPVFLLLLLLAIANLITIIFIRGRYMWAYRRKEIWKIL
jgi:hypothetical protein